MSDYSIFDIAGPVMIGPSSSHTGGAAKIGLIARAIFGVQPEKVTFFLHGSFGQVYMGHATDKALLSGLLGFETHDTRLKHSFELAKKAGIDFEFKKKNLGKDKHPNTVKIVMKAGDKEMSILGSSVGGGIIEIKEIDNFRLHLSCAHVRLYTMLIWHKHRAGLTNEMTGYFVECERPVSHLVSARDPHKIESALTVVVLNEKLNEKQLTHLRSINGIEKIQVLDQLAV